MKRICLMLCSLMMLLSGCSGSKIPEIEDVCWEMTTVQSTSDGSIVACGEKFLGAEENAVRLQLFCTVENEVLTLQDRTNGNIYTGTCEQRDSDLESVMYAVTLEGEDCYAVTSLTKYQDKDAQPTMLLAVGDKTLTFQKTDREKADYQPTAQNDKMITVIP